METRMGPPPSSQLDLLLPENDNNNLTTNSSSSNQLALLGLQLPSDTAIAASNHPATSPLNTWAPSYHNTYSPSPGNNQALNYLQYYPARLTNDQDAWNPLQVTGVPANTGAAASFGFTTRPNKPRPVSELGAAAGGRYNYPSYQNSAPPSECGSQYNGVTLSDSGYGSRSCATRSVVTSSQVQNSVYNNSNPNPLLASFEGKKRLEESQSTISLSHHGALSFNDSANDELTVPADNKVLPRPPSRPRRSQSQVIKCDYPNCPWFGKFLSEKRRHEARHKKEFKCDVKNCTRKEGFGTLNDLERHMKCVHKKAPERGPQTVYMCFGRGCPHKNKRWPRFDNFKKHLSSMHEKEDLNELLRKSNAWYQEWVKAKIILPQADRLSTPEPQGFETQSVSDSGCATKGLYLGLTSDSVAPSQTINTADFLQPPDNPILSQARNSQESQRSECFLGPPALEVPQSVELPDLKNLKLPPSPSLNNARKGYMDRKVAEAAANVIGAMTRMINGVQRRGIHDGGVDETPELSDKKREILRKILLAALDQLAESTGPNNHNPGKSRKMPVAGSEKKGWVECDYCQKKTRRLCDMKKHKRRHERPYGCTFPKCYKTFGSKADWKRHENSQHFHLQSWRCTLQDCTEEEGKQCARLFYRQELYVHHLQKEHKVAEDHVRTAILRNRIGRNGQSQFWCGFCREIIPLEIEGLGAWDERFNHIDSEHLKKGQRMGDWLSPSGHLTKKQEQEEEKKKLQKFNRTDSGAGRSRENDDSFSRSNRSSTSCSSSSDEEIYNGKTETTKIQNNNNNNAADMRNRDRDIMPTIELPEEHPESNARKRKSTTLHSSLHHSSHQKGAELFGTSAQKRSKTTPSTKDSHSQLTTSDNNNNNNNNNGRKSRKEVSDDDDDGDEKKEEQSAIAERLFSFRHESEPDRVVFCCQCQQPTGINMTRCVLCSHDFCTLCELVTLDPPEE